MAYHHLPLFLSVHTAVTAAYQAAEKLRESPDIAAGALSQIENAVVAEKLASGSVVKILTGRRQEKPTPP
ncbi:MAG: hypothetical protein ACLU7V_02400 [Anaerovoracaceae bacterium]|nr:hypothetical protein [Anaerovoracaceae bacterium]